MCGCRGQLGGRHSSGHCQEPNGSGLGGVLAVPGHDAILRVGSGMYGGARGCSLRWKISMMTMRPPQHGQGGNGVAAGAAGGSSGSAAMGGATASNSLARAILALQPALASRP